MRTLSETLIAAQKAGNRRPYLRVQARNTPLDVVKLKWTRVYSGEEAENQHALTLPGDGSLVRVRITPAEDNLELYRQRVVNPGPESDYSQWTSHLGQYGIKAAAVCSLGAEVSLVWARSNGEIRRSRSLDYGATWQATEYPGYAPSSEVNSLAAAYKPNGDLGIFFTDGNTLYLIKRVSGEWQSRTAWDKSTGDLCGTAAIYADGDWKLIVTGQDTEGNYRAWTLIYGDGGEAEAGTWTDLKMLASAPSDGNYEYTRPFLDKADTYRGSFLEKFSGEEAYERPFLSYRLPGTAFPENRWKESVPFEAESAAGIALGHAGEYAWAGSASSLWRACLTEESLDLSGDLLGAKVELEPEKGEAMLVLDNSSGKYAGIDGGLLEDGNEVSISPGYYSAAGSEYSEGLYFVIQGYEHTSTGGKASVILYANDGRQGLENWKARSQLRWNKPDAYGEPVEEASVKEILAQVLARAGIKLETRTQSTVITGFYPDYTIHPGDSGETTVKQLLSLVPDVIFLEGNTAYLMNPLPEDEAVYAYGNEHMVLEGRYRKDAWKINRVQAEGRDPDTGEPVIVESYNWEEIEKNGDRPALIEDENLHTAEQAHERGEAVLREAEMESSRGWIRIPVNCGQQLYDVIEITDQRAGLEAALKRVLGLTLNYIPAKAVYEQKLEMGKV